MLSLPRTTNKYKVHEDARIALVKSTSARKVPRYGRERKGWIPKKAADFGDGGAFPEIHVVQFPLDMGKPNKKHGSVLTTTVNDRGEVEFDAIVKRDGKKVWSSASDLVEANGSKKLSLDEPSEEVKLKSLENTKAALEAIVGLKVSATKVTQLPDDPGSQSSQYITYNPSSNGPNGESGKARVIRMVEAPVDPLELPKFKHKKIPDGLGEDPVPVMQETPKKLTAEEQRERKIPPCVSNWKNAKGYTVPLDKRLAADGRGLAEVTINDKFAKLSEALYIAENQARQEVQERNKIKSHLAQQERRKKEEELRDLAAQARLERANLLNKRESEPTESDQQRKDAESNRMEMRGRTKSRSRSSSVSSSGSSSSSSSDSTDDGKRRKSTARKHSGRPKHQGRDRDRNPTDIVGDLADTSRKAGSRDRDELDAMRERERLRIQRKRDRERDLKLEAAGKKTKLSRDRERDISERIALGMHVPKQATGETQYDARLFNQTQGMDSGFGADDSYNIYDKALFNRDSQKIYRPKADESSKYGSAEDQYNKLKSTDKFRPAKDFSGVDRSKPQAQRDGPVQFEKDPTDPFGGIMGGETRRTGEKLSKLERNYGAMSASAGTGKAEEYIGGSSRNKINFTKSSK